jgi:hypothetical protein
MRFAANSMPMGTAVFFVALGQHSTRGASGASAKASEIKSRGGPSPRQQRSFSENRKYAYVRIEASCGAGKVSYCVPAEEMEALLHSVATQRRRASRTASASFGSLQGLIRFYLPRCKQSLPQSSYEIAWDHSGFFAGRRGARNVRRSDYVFKLVQFLHKTGRGHAACIAVLIYCRRYRLHLLFFASILELLPVNTRLNHS